MINRYGQHYICEPIYNMAGRLKAVEVLTAFTTSDGKNVSWSDVSDILTPEYKWLNFVRQLHCIHLHQKWLKRNHVAVLLNLDEDIASFLVRDGNILKKLSQMPFMKLEVNENYPLSDKEKHGVLSRVCLHVPLWLDDVGSGSHNNFELLVRGFFSGAKIDKSFFWQYQTTNMVKFEKAVRDLMRFAGHVVVEGVESKKHLLSLVEIPHCWIQGYLFQRLCLDFLEDTPLLVEGFFPRDSASYI